ncbi:MAG: TIGR04083 family peptide-modifying radical SAM enzyme [Methanomicrobiales archaeon]|nr:TIGR04083 family peptide-modifying radical SAM enzyme [Methanomicrobiales archaeon]
MKNPFHIMLVPTLGCPARCTYCWSSESGSPVMSIDTVRDTVAWLKDFRNDRLTITFHGGEPLLAGIEFYKAALPLLSRGLEHLKPEFAMQSNLWLMTPDLARVLAEYPIPIGTSIDGPADLNDRQRGMGYFARTMHGAEIATANGLPVRFICTFTSASVRKKEKIFQFFLEHGFTMKLHPALPSLRDEEAQEWTLAPEAYGDLLVYLLDKSLDHLGQIEIMNISDLVRCVFTRRGTVCTFADCMGNTFAIGPDGSIYPCYRFIGMPAYVMGNVADKPTKEALAHSPAGVLMARFKEYVDTACKECAHIRYCRGGCPYNAIVPTHGKIDGVDPYCIAYKRIFGEISDRFNREMQESYDMKVPRFGSGSQKDAKPSMMMLMHRIILR